MKYFYLIILFLITITAFPYGNNGTIIGVVRDAETNEPLPSADVFIKGTTIGTTTDFDGNYSISLKENTYTLIFNYNGYKKVIVTDIKIKSKEIFNLDISLIPESNTLDEVVLTASVARNTEASVLNFQKRSVHLMDGISAQSLRKSGASNLASAVKKIPGVTIENGKYVYVRGLGDRYTKTILNDMEIPGLDPDKNTLQMDIFSTSILDNVIVIKSFTADMSADFTGGLVNIITKDFPTKKTYSFSLGSSYNPAMHFNSNYRNYPGSNTDLFGFDNGLRSHPIASDTAIPFTFDNNPELTRLTKQFNPNMASTTSQSMMDYNFGFSAGNQFDLGVSNNKLGYIASINYKNSTKFYDNTQNYSIGSIASDGEISGKSQNGSLGENNVTLSVLTGLAYKTEFSRYKLNVLHIQNGESKAGSFLKVNNDSDFVTYKKDYLDYTQRAITNTSLSGKHSSNDYNFNVKWNLSSSFSSIYDKDVRTTVFQINDNNYSINQNTEPRRVWRDLIEQNHVAKLSFSKKYSLFKQNAKLKYGISGLYKKRDYNVYNYRIGIKGNTEIYNGDANTLLADENIWTIENDRGSFVRNTTIMDPANQFKASQVNLGVYISNEFKLIEKIKTVLGVRVEKFQVNYTGENTTGETYNNQAIINKLDVFPSVNMIYELKEDNKLRVSFTTTTARPSFKEASIAEIYDPLSNITFIGNTNLKPSYINNFDLRYELFMKKSQLFALSGFFKSFKDPIELTYYQTAPDNFTPKNLGAAKVYGIELEIRKNLGFINSKLEHLKFNFNTSIIRSKLNIGEDEMTLRQNTARPDEKVKSTRTLQGQAPYLINLNLDYDIKKMGLEVGMHYNVQGETLEVVGGIAPDVFTQAFHDLKLVLNKSIGSNKKSSVKLKISNILRQERSSLYHLYNMDDIVFKGRKTGTSFSLGYKYRF